MRPLRSKFEFSSGQELLKPDPPPIVPQMDSVNHFCSALLKKMDKTMGEIGNGHPLSQWLVQMQKKERMLVFVFYISSK